MAGERVEEAQDRLMDPSEGIPLPDGGGGHVPGSSTSTVKLGGREDVNSTNVNELPHPPHTTTTDEFSSLVNKLAKRGLDRPRELIPDGAELVRLEAAVEQYDRRKLRDQGVSPGLLAWMLKQGGVDPETRTRYRRPGYDVKTCSRTACYGGAGCGFPAGKAPPVCHWCGCAWEEDDA